MSAVPTTEAPTAKAAADDAKRSGPDVLPRRPRLALAGSALGYLALIPWMGGLAVVGAVVAPMVFRLIGNPAEAGEVMQPIFIRLDGLYMVCAVLLLAGEGLRAAGLGRQAAFAWPHVPRLPLAVAMAALAAWGRYFVHPEMVSLRAGQAMGTGDPEAWVRFEQLHHIAESAAKAQLWLGLALLVLSLVGGWIAAGAVARLRGGT
jgi:hypothetical protein